MISAFEEYLEFPPIKAPIFPVFPATVVISEPLERFIPSAAYIPMVFPSFILILEPLATAELPVPLL